MSIAASAGWGQIAWCRQSKRKKKKKKEMTKIKKQTVWCGIMTGAFLPDTAEGDGKFPIALDLFFGDDWLAKAAWRKASVGCQSALCRSCATLAAFNVFLTPANCRRKAGKRLWAGHGRTILFVAYSHGKAIATAGILEGG